MGKPGLTLNMGRICYHIKVFEQGAYKDFNRGFYSFERLCFPYFPYWFVEPMAQTFEMLNGTLYYPHLSFVKLPNTRPGKM